MAFKYDSNGKVIWTNTRPKLQSAPPINATQSAVYKGLTYGNDPVNNIVNDPNYRGISAYYADNNLNTPKPAVTQPATPPNANTQSQPLKTTINPISTSGAVYNQGSQQTQQTQQNPILENILKSISEGAKKLIAEQQRTIDEAPGVYQKYKDTAYNQSLAGLPTLYERLANLGASQSGGLSLSEQGKVRSNLQNNLTNFDLQKQATINDAQRNIADINSDVASQTSAKTADYLMNEQSRQDEQTARAEQNAWNTVSTLGYVDANSSKVLGIPEGTKTAATNQIEWEREQSEKETAKDTHETEVSEFVNTIGQYSGDYQKEILKITNDGDTSNDWKLPYLKAARQQKVNEQEAAKIAAKNAQKTAITEYNQNMFDKVMDIWQTSGYVPKGGGKYVGYPDGTPSSAQVKANKAKTTGKSTGKSSSGSKDLSPAQINTQTNALASQIDKTYWHDQVMMTTDAMGKETSKKTGKRVWSVAEKLDAARYITGLIGTYDNRVINNLFAKYGMNQTYLKKNGLL